MDNLRQAAQKALDSLETLAEHFEYFVGDNESRPLENAYAAITTLRAALEQPQQEPVAWRCTGDENRCSDGNGCECDMNGVPLTDSATPEQPRQMPVAWVNHGENRITRVIGWDGYGALYAAPQPAREWVDLTDEDWDQIQDLAAHSFRRHRSSVSGQMIMPGVSYEWHLVQVAAAKLKEKNYG